jgi:hypothetical protein
MEGCPFPLTVWRICGASGATGYLEIHVLREDQQTEEETVYCLLRGDRPEVKLKSLCFYCFDGIM